MAEPNNPQSKRWCLTVHDDTWTPTFTQDMAFAVWQRERCPETGRLHVHVYVRFNTRKRMNTVKNVFIRQDAHCEIAKGNEQQCTDYCEKEESRVEAGARWHPENFKPDEGKQGKRSDLEAIAAKCQANVPMVQIAQEHPADFIRYHHGIQVLHALVTPKPPLQREVTVRILWGPTGTGKTHRVMTAYPDVYCVKPGRDPWGAYRQEDAVFFDEFDYTKWSIQEMNRLLDKWRILLDARYQDRYAAWTRVFICSNDNPASWYPEASGPLIMALHRRMSNGACRLVENRDTPLEELPINPEY